ncbi:phosphatidylglycerophosphatase A [Chromobacterium sp. IIBBL 290-4]|uniref:phosphatidylglycerophosphatase A family protein n=1 Tax=Chromobacterium sp. IIBBL 290-4 TaxID=2953890 RepID=UPI0020B7AB38|nr:phosphatidylglycerophosphatase A [Chromobacterium sp. IIBBL 290-4]UTH73898.1 phosphatidylglycerophosphatase A [Chromobacterium sp. IIBBL 290-4]
MTTSAEALKVTPNWRFLLRHPAHLLAFGFGSGLMRKAPGTWGTLVAFPLFFPLHALGVGGWALMALCVPLFIIGVYVCEVTGKALGVHDYGGIVWDEVVGMLMVLAFAPASWAGCLVAFALFRLFDIVKPWPIRWFDARVGGGFGVMVDDVIAAVFALAVQYLIWDTF